MQPEFHRVQAADEVGVERPEVRRQQVAVGVDVVFEERRRHADARVGEDVVDAPVLLLGGFEPGRVVLVVACHCVVVHHGKENRSHLDLLLPRRHVDSHEWDIGRLGLGEGVDVAGKHAPAVAAHSPERGQPNARGRAWQSLASSDKPIQ